jgi:transcriptional regulator with XRE-family HTH domain
LRVRTDQDLANVVRERRLALGLSQGELAFLAGTSRVTVNKVESGHYGAALSTVLRLLDALSLEMDVELVPRSRLDEWLGHYLVNEDAPLAERLGSPEPHAADVDPSNSDEVEL